MARLLKCSDCLTVELLPDFLGPKAEEEHDPLLAKLVDAHRGPLNREQLAHRPPGAPRVRDIELDERHFGDLFNVPNTDWYHPDSDTRAAIQGRILTGMWGATSGYPPEFYAAKDTYRDDAAVCYQRHGRPVVGEPGCPDFESDAKRLTDLNWVARGMNTGAPRDHVYLCAFCPYQSTVITAKRMARGDYDS